MVLTMMPAPGAQDRLAPPRGARTSDMTKEACTGQRYGPAAAAAVPRREEHVFSLIRTQFASPNILAVSGLTFQ
jgi:hypothetical protein